MATSHPVHDHTTFHNWRILWWAVWCIVGVGAVVVAFDMGVFGEVNARLRGWLGGYPFYLPAGASGPSPLSTFLFMIAVTLFFVQSLLYTCGFFRRLLLWFSVLAVLLLTVPVCAMWGVYMSTSSLLLSLIVSGAGAVITPLFLKSLRLPSKQP